MLSLKSYKHKASGLVVLALAAAGVAATVRAAAWAENPQDQQSKTQQVPDAPSAVRPAPTQFPSGTKAAPVNPPRQAPEDAPANIPEGKAPAGETQQSPATESSQPQSTGQPSSQVTTAPPRHAKDPAAEDTGREPFQLVVNVNLVTVPVTVKDGDNRLVDGLLRKDFILYEDGVRQPIKFFTSDPFPLSAAVVIDDNIAASAMKKINQTLPSIAGAFSQFDEVAVYTYGDNVHSVADFAAAGEQITAALRRLKLSGHQGGVPVTSGPLQSGPSINGHPLDPSTPHVITPAKESHVMNDAILRAAMELSKREKARRRIIFLVSDGKEEGSEASYRDVLKVLLSYDISVYAIGVDSAAIPGYDKLSQVHIPDMGYGNLLPKYVSATGGQYFAEFTRDAIEQTYARLTEIARNQYTLGYTTRLTPAGTYRTVEVRVLRPNLKVVARDGYYPLPPRRTSP